MPEEKKEPTFKKIEKAMVYLDSEGKAVYLGLPTKIKEMKGGKAGISLKISEGLGGEVAGSTYSEVDYKWTKITDEPVTEQDLVESTKAVATTSGTTIVSSGSAVTNPPIAYVDYCSSCKSMILKGSKYCNQCGAKIE
ncbi:MAG: zinc ribbon domain-containing protein [Candidatus Bathyarchaeia archaeon]